MKATKQMLEYGAVVDPKIQVEPPDPDELQMGPYDPGHDDPDYVKRRKELFALCRKHRLEKLGPPIIQYNADETSVWREVTPKLDELHRKYACSMYLKAKDELGITQTEIPQMKTLSEQLGRYPSRMHLVPAEGSIAYRIFYSYISERGFPVTQFIRHKSQPGFTPEPDMIHDCLGHVPPLVNEDYAAVLVLIAKAANATPDPFQVQALKRFSWFSIEFGLIEEHGENKVFGAGILSSLNEIPHSILDKDVQREPFVTDIVIETDYPHTRMQDRYFIIPSFAFLRSEAENLVKRFGINV
jgi:phenylalanine-4-hydroxylase